MAAMAAQVQDNGLDPTVLLLQEIQSITSAMRRNQRWANTGSSSSYTSGSANARLFAGQGKRDAGDDDEGDLMLGFVELRRAIYDANDISNLDPSIILRPFLALIKSPSTSGPITSLALLSTATLLTHLGPLHTITELSSLTSSLAACRFPSSSPSQDELVLLRLLKVIEVVMLGPLEGRLGDEGVCELLEVGLGMGARPRLSESLRTTAQTTVQTIVRKVFQRLPAQPSPSSSTGSSPYGLPTHIELLRVLIALLNPTDQAHTDSMRLSALSILHTALQTSGGRIAAHNDLADQVRDTAARYLFQLIRTDNPVILGAGLRTTSTMLATMQPSLKLQLELFLCFLIDRLAPPATTTQNGLPPSAKPSHLGGAMSRPSSPAPGASANIADSVTVPAETRELLLETLAQLARRKSFMVDCWVNYDCESESEDVYERLVGFLTRGVYPTPGGSDGAQMMCLDILLGFVGAMADRVENAQAWPDANPTPAALAQAKADKATLLAGAAKFNTKPKIGVAFLEDNGVLPKPTDPDHQLALAKFLRSSSRLDKKLLGEYISAPDRTDLLKHFIGLFDFSGKSIADAMRELLETFRLPGEAQPIARITETFANVFIAGNPPEIDTEDAAYVLAYSVIMLNTDLHNPQNRKRMTIDDYKRNLRGVNGGKDFDPEYLKNIHDSIRRREIIMPEEHVGQPGFDFAWKSLMQRARTAAPMLSCNTNAFDEAMFKLAWKPIISALAYAFTSGTQDEGAIQRAITGFRQCATLAARFGLADVFDDIVLSLANATGLLDETEEGYQVANHPVVETDNQTVTVSPLSIRIGSSYRSQLATVVLFTIANGNGNAIREGWLQIFEMFQTLFLHSLLPTPMLQMEDFLAGTTTIAMKPAVPAQSDARRAESGLLSTLSSYLLSPYGAGTEGVVTEATDEDVENTLTAVDCISSCRLEELYAEILNLDVDALLPALRAIKTLAEARTVGRLGRTSLDARADRSTSPTIASAVVRDGQFPYDPACVFHLEMMISLATHSKSHIAETWPVIFEYISALLGSAQSFSVLLIERAVVGLLRLCLIVSEEPQLRDQLYIALDVLRSLPSSVLNAVSEQLMAGVAKILEKDRDVVKSQTEWGLVTALFRATVSHPEASKVTLATVQKMASGAVGPGLSVDNYSGVVALLDEFATAAGAAAAGRQQQSRRTSAGPQTATLGPTVERGLAALESLYELRGTIPGLIKTTSLPAGKAWETFWLPVLLAISKQCVNGSRDIRQRAIGYLQRLLLSPQLLSGDTSELATIFDRVLFPIVEELLKPQVNDRDPQGMPETRLRAATLMCKIFLQYVVRLDDKQTVADLFARVLDKMERFMRGERENLNEASESLKNVVLVMHSSALLVPPPSGHDTRSDMQKTLWTTSAGRIEKVVPGFLAEAFPAEPEQVAPAPHPAVPTANTGSA